MTPYIDIHTHKHTSQTTDEISIISLDYDSDILQFCSVGIHPWHSIRADDNPTFIDESIAIVAEKSTRQEVVAIGEAGIDKLRGADIHLQRELFRRQIQISEETHKPLIIHMVKSADEIVTFHRTLHPSQRWIIHGFRGKEEQARQLLNQGIELSFGAFFNEKALKLAYDHNMLWLETDESSIDISSHYNQVAKVLGIDVNILKHIIYHRFCRREQLTMNNE